MTSTKSQQQTAEAIAAAMSDARAAGLSEEEVQLAAAEAAREIREKHEQEAAERASGAGKDDAQSRYYALAHAVSEKITRAPALLRPPNHATLREYQLVGLQWMVSLYNNKLNGILADEMGARSARLGGWAGGGWWAEVRAGGPSAPPIPSLPSPPAPRLPVMPPKPLKHFSPQPLKIPPLEPLAHKNKNHKNHKNTGLGKTVQVMALIAYLMEARSNFGPHLIIVPNAVAVNWRAELNAWLPAARCVYYLGKKDERARQYTAEVRTGGCVCVGGGVWGAYGCM